LRCRRRQAIRPGTAASSNLSLDKPRVDAILERYLTGLEDTRKGLLFLTRELSIVVTEWFAELNQIIEAVPSDPEALVVALQQVDRTVELLAPENALKETIDELQKRLDRAPEATLVRYARARLQEQAGQAAAPRGFARAARDLAEAGHRQAARHAARRAVSLGQAELVPFLLQLSRQIGDPVAASEDLALAAQEVPNSPAVLRAEAQAAQEQGRLPRAVLLISQALRGFVAVRQEVEAEDALLFALEVPSESVARDLIALLPVMIEEEMVPLAEATLDLLESLIEEYDLHQPLAQTLEQMLRLSPSSASLRQRYMEVVGRFRGDPETVKAAVATSDLANPEASFEQALAAFWRALNFAPGALVKHNQWGLGKIISAGRAGLVIDFPQRLAHRMATSMAEHSLTPVPPHSLEAQIHTQLEELVQQAQQDPVALLVRVIAEEDGEAASSDFKQWLAGPVIPEAQWSSWWKQVRQAAAEDPRIDHSEAFRGRYRRSYGEAKQIELPPLQRQRGLGVAVQIIERLLEQHPELKEPAVEKYGPVLSDWVQKDEAPEARMRGALLLADWYPQDRARWAEMTAQVLAQIQSLNFLAEAPAQRAVLQLTGETTAAAAILVLALGSRFAEIRDLAKARLQALGEALPGVLGPYLESERTPPAVQVEVVRLALETSSVGEDNRPPWQLFLALARVLPGATTRRDFSAATELFARSGRLAELLSGRACPPELELQVQGALAALPHDSPTLELIQAFLAAAEHQGYVRYLQEGPPAPTPSLSPERDPQVVLMTGETYRGKQARRAQLRRELAGEIPRQIAAARELGDLSENADYHAARERQGLAAAEVRSLQALLDRAQIIEDLELSEDRVSVGMEVRLWQMPDGPARTVWVLGQDDSYHGPEVINYRAGLGQALLGHRPGERIEIPTADDTVTYEIVAVKRRLPEPNAEKE